MAVRSDRHDADTVDEIGGGQYRDHARQCERVSGSIESSVGRAWGLRKRRGRSLVCAVIE